MVNNKLVIFTGPSGVGKGTIEKFLFNNEELKLRLSRSVTTRKPREGEVNGVDYFFISKKEFQTKIAKNELIEWNQHFDNFYGTLYEEVENILDSGYNPFLEIETMGALNVLEYYKNNNLLDKVISIFLLPPSLEELKERITKRGTESPEQILSRLNKAEEEIAYISSFDHVVINQDIEKTAAKITLILAKRLQ